MADRSAKHKTTLYLDSELHREARVLAIRRGISLTELIETALRQYLHRQSRSKAGGNRDER
jgi:hypothetical protein